MLIEEEKNKKLSFLDDSMSEALNKDIEKEIGNPKNNSKESTLNESIRESFMRDLTNIINKIIVIYTFKKENNSNLKKEIINYELFGPLLFTLLMTILLTISNKNSDIEIIFSSIFLLIVGGSLIITINSKLLKQNISLYQGISIIGYSIVPLLASQILKILLPDILNLILIFSGFILSVIICFNQIDLIASPEKSNLVKYPILLYLFSLFWIITFY